MLNDPVAMSQNDRKRAPDSKGSVPPELRDVDLRWDDDAAPSSLELDLGEDDDAFDRVTAVPDIPNEVLARRLMERADTDPQQPASRPRSNAGKPPPSAPTHSLYDADYDEQTLKVDAEGLRQRARHLSSDPGPVLTFEFTPESDVPPSSGTSLNTPSSAPDEQESVAASPDLPPALGFGGRAPHVDAEPPAQRFQREPSVPRTRLPTAELILELDAPQPESALELAENAPFVERSSDVDLEFQMPSTNPSSPTPRTDSEAADMKDRYAMGDFTGALVVAESILEANPGNPEAQRCAERCRDVLTQMYSARLGPLSQIVSIAIPNDEIRWLSLDHRAGFLLSLVDGSLTLEEILDISGMSKLDALRLMFTLFDQHVISLK